ncbi:MAG TPA: glycosyltransferase family 4 protein [Gaiellaceae bacterium]|nr:glycosyltransferase family 4 protein [Gaiellaceae bacterium]
MMIMRSQSGVPGGAGVPGGQIGMVQLARALTRLDMDVELFVGGPRMGYLSGLEGVTTTYFEWPAWLDGLIKASPAPVRILGQNLRRRRWLDAATSLPGLALADVIHIQGLEDAESLLMRLSGPLVVTHWGRVGRWLPRGLSPDDDQSLLHRIQRIRENVKLIAIGEAQGEVLAAAGMPPAEVIPPGIDLHHFKPGDRAEARRHVELPADSSIVLFVGRLAADKNVETLLRAFARLPPRSRRTRLLIIGDGPLRTQLQRLSGELGIDASTTFLPFVPHRNLPWYYRASDIAVVPSNYLETFCMVALEAIACGCPLIVTDQVPEILRRFPTVPSVAPYEVEALRDMLDAALEDHVQPADATQMADYDWSGVARRYADLYRTALRHAA